MASARPHLVMAVGNAAIGDSRVEKAAISAREAGLRVTVLAIQRRNTRPYGWIDGNIPVLRLDKRRKYYTDEFIEEIQVARDKSRELLEAIITAGIDVDQAQNELEDASGSRIKTKLLQLKLASVEKNLTKLKDEFEELIEAENTKSLAAFPDDSMWGETWPELLDYRDVFYDGFRTLEPDLIHVHDIHPMAGAEAYCEEAQRDGKNIRWVYDAHEWLPGQPFYQIPPTRHLGWMQMERELAPKAAAVLTVSEQMSGQLQERLKLDHAPGVVYNAPMLDRRKVDLSPRKTLREECGLDDSTPLMVYVGGIQIRRGVLTMVETVARHPHLHAAFVAPPADSINRRRINDRAKELGVSERIHVVNYVPADAVSTYVSSADIGLSPLLETTAHHQAAPTKVREYMLADIPVIVSNMRVQSELVNRLQIGEVFTAGDPVALVEAVDKVLADKSKYTDNYNRDMLFDNSWDRCIPALLEAWQKTTDLDLSSLQKPVPQTASGASRLVIKISDDSPYAPLADELQSRSDLEVVNEFAVCDLESPIGPEEDIHRFETGRKLFDYWRTDLRNVAGFAATDPIHLAPGVPDAAFNPSLVEQGIKNGWITLERDMDHVRSLAKSFPDHFANDLDADQLGELHEHQTEKRMDQQRNRRFIITPYPQTAMSFRYHGIYLPIPLTTFAEHPQSNDPSTIKIGILPALRSDADFAAMDELRNQANLDVSDVSEHASDAELAAFDLVIGSLGDDHYPPLGARAMAQGVAVLTGRHPSKRYEHQVTGVPSIRFRPSEIVEKLSTMDRATVEQHRADCLAYAKEHHNVSTVADQFLVLMLEGK